MKERMKFSACHKIKGLAQSELQVSPELQRKIRKINCKKYFIRGGKKMASCYPFGTPCLPHGYGPEQKSV